MVMFVLVNEHEHDTVEWHIGSSTNDVNLVADRVVSVFADEQELLHIEHKFTNLPMRPGGRHVTWFGDMAKFIAKNL